MIEAAIHAAKRTGPLRRFYYEVERKKGGRVTKVAKVATARKLLEWVYHMLREGETFPQVEKVVEFLKSPGPVL